MDEMKLAALLSSRLCHDLIGPVGAVNNGVELLADEDDGTMRDQAMELVANSAQEAGRRLQFYRMAFGAATGMGAEIGLNDARKAAEGLFMQGKTTLHWPPDDGIPVDKQVVKLLLNMVLLTGGALARGGDLNVGLTREAGSLRLRVTAAGPRAAFNDGHRAVLTGAVGHDQIDAHNVQPWYTLQLAKSLDTSIELDESQNDQVEIAAVV
jgi:histidine phosphotransferase ChpT